MRRTRFGHISCRGFTAALLSLCALAASACGRPAGAAPSAEGGSESRVVLTTGEAVIRRAADQAFITISVESRAQNPKTAQTRNADVMNAVRARIAQTGVPDGAVQTVTYELSRGYTSVVKEREVFRGDLVKNAIEVRLDDVIRIGEAIDLAVAAGATSVDGPRFDLRDRTTVVREALKQAAADAHAKAEAAAAGAGGALDRVVQIQEHGVSEEAPRRTLASAFGRAASAPRPPTPIAPGTVDPIHVTLTAALK